MSGASSMLGVHAGPVSMGLYRSCFTPSPKKKTPRRRGRGAPCAYAVPFASSIASSVGSPSETAVPPSMPRRTVRRVIVLLAMTLPSDLVDGFRGVLEAGALHDRLEERSKLQPRAPEFVHHVAEDALFAAVVDVTHGVAVRVLRDAGD